MTADTPTARRTPDPTAVAVAGAMTLAWYAVPDVARRRGVRALLKSVVGVAGAVATVTATRDGRDLQDAVRTLRDTARAAADGTLPTDGEASDGTPDDGPREDNAYVPAVDDAPFPVPPAVLAAASVGAVALSAALVVAGEKWAYRRGERLRERGVRLPHTRVGVAMAGVAVALAVAEPFLWKGEDTEPTA
ncbi:hypothetical protein [Cellulosimicrobium marinum]|uniref:hypothetical protein n=1 Tax=Cellulosimicrobium marinum TaxID=1638992 RepID=UPI001E465D37|nr:hypothetical protein [Cellulosimicrobium marinum]MCB7135169.1 hypothetical protein [Cellulosimicrobium marinum]